MVSVEKPVDSIRNFIIFETLPFLFFENGFFGSKEYCVAIYNELCWGSHHR
jgi:hypothetical protein